MSFSRTAAIGLILGSTFGVIAGVNSASADDVIVPGAFVVAELPQQDPLPTVAPLPPARSVAFAPRPSRTATTASRTVSAPVERIAFAEPRRRIEANAVSFAMRPNFMWIGTVY